MTMTVLIFIALIFGAFAAAGWIVPVYQSISAFRNNLLKSWQNIDLVLQQRNNELPGLMEACKAFTKDESVSLFRVAELSTAYAAESEIEKRINIENELSSLLSKLKMAWKDCPELEALHGPRQARDRILSVEAKIADRREAFNDAVSIYNIQVERIPDILIARIMNCRKMPFLHVPEHPVEKRPSLI